MLFLKKHFWKSSLIFITVLGAILRFRVLGTYPMDRDELARVVPEFSFTSFVPPGFILLTKIGAYLFNNSDFGFRLPVFMFAILGIISIYFLGKKLFGKLEGLISAFSVAFLFGHISYSNQAKEYVPVMTFATISSIIFSNLLKSFSRKNLITYIAFNFLAILFSSYLFVLFIFYQIAFFAITAFPSLLKKAKKFPFKILASFFIILFLALGSLVFKKIDSYFGFNFIWPNLSFIKEYWSNLSFFVTQDREYGHVTNSIFILGIILFLFVRRFRRGIFYLASIILMDFLLTSIVRFKHSAFPLFYIRYHSFLFPLYVSIVGAVLASPYYLIKNKKISYIVISLFVFLTLFRIHPILKWYYRLPSLISTNFRDAGKYLNEHLAKGDTLVRIKNFSMEQKYNHINHYIDPEVMKNLNYSIFPERSAANNWYVTFTRGDEDEQGFSDYLFVERIRPSLRYSAPLISKLKYFGPFIRTREVINKKDWKIEVSSGESSKEAVIDNDFNTAWEGEDIKTMKIDLGKIYLLNSIRFSFSELYPQKFSLSVSKDGFEKKEIFNFSGAATDSPNSQIFFEPVDARFILISLKGSGIKEINVWEAYQKEIEDLNKEKIIENGLPGIQIKDDNSPNGYTEFIPYDKDEDYTFFQIGKGVKSLKGKYKVSFKIKVDKVFPNWKNKLGQYPKYRLYEYLEPKDTSDSDILYVSVETTRGTFYNSPAYLNVHGEDFKEANKYYNFSLVFSANGKETLFIQAFNPKNRRYPANLYITYPQIEVVR